MTTIQAKLGITALRLVMGIVILAEAVQFVLPGAAYAFARTHIPDAIRLIVGFGEIVGSVLLLIPPTAVRGAWVLVGVFIFAIIPHLLHGMYGLGNLAIYAAAAFAIAAGN
jgi:uncharacterized membrane protein YphA (DoxX/SURF4 family)